MTYFIKKTTGESLVEILDSAINTTATDLTLIGKNVLGYGEYINENFVKILENFASTSEPNNPIVGQLWYDISESRVKVYDGNGFAVASGPIVSTTPPLTPNQGDFWIDAKENQLYFYDGTDRQLAGPIYKDSQGLSGFEVVTIKDTLGNSKTVTLLWNNANLLGIWSHHAEFTAVGLSNFSGIVKPGFNVNPKIKNFKFHGVSTSAESLVDSTGVVKSVDNLVFTNTNNSLTGTMSILNSMPLVLGANQETTLLSNLSFFQIRSNVSNQDIKLTTKSPSSFVDAITIKSNSNKIGIFNDSPTASLDVNGNVVISGDLTVNGSTVTINSTDLTVDDKTITLAATKTPTDALADLGGVVLKGTADKTILWSLDSNSWEFSEHVNLLPGKTYKINDTEILSENTLSHRVTSAVGLTQIGKLVDLTVDDVYIDNTTISAGSNTLYLHGLMIDASGKRITNLQSPFLETDAVNKQYVDSVVDTPWQVVNSFSNVKNRSRILANTMSSQVIIGLPLNPQQGDTVRFLDYYGTFAINNLIVARYRNHKVPAPNGGALVLGEFSDLLGNGIPTIGGSGTGLTVKVNITSLGTYTDSSAVITVINQGHGYQLGDKVTVPGTALGGTSPANDLVFEITAQSPILGLDQDLVVSKKNASFGLVYINPSQGWVYTETSVNNVPSASGSSTIPGATPGSPIVSDLVGDVTGNLTGQVFGNVTGSKVTSATSLALTSTLADIRLVSGKSGVRVASFEDTGVEEQVNLQIIPGTTPANRSSTVMYGNVVIDNSKVAESNGASFRLPQYTTADRDSRSLTIADYGELIYNLDTDTVQAYTKAGWVNLH